MDEPKISIIIPFITLNNYILDCILHCLSLNYSNYNLILVADERIDLPQELKNNPKIKIINTGPLSIAEKRNSGINNSPRDVSYYAFIDSDAYPHNEWLKNAIKFFQTSEEIWGVGGPIICPTQEEFRRRIASNALKSILLGGINAKNFRENIAKDRKCSWLPTCNLIVRKQAIEQIGNFNENYITGEDIEFCRRVIKKNKNIFFSKDVIVYHHSRQIFLPFIRQRITYGLSVKKITRKNYAIINLYFFLPLLFILFLISLFILSLHNYIFYYILSSVIFSYFLIVLIESFRWSSQIKEIPFVFLAIILGNLAMLFGILMSLLNLPVNIRRIFTQVQ